MTVNISAQVCVMGAGPVGGTLACRLAGRRQRCRRRSGRAAADGASRLRRARVCDRRGVARAAGECRAVGAAAGDPNPIRDIRVSDGRVGRRASRLHLHFDCQEATGRREGGDPGTPFGWMVEARALRRALNAALPERPLLRVFAPARASVERSADASGPVGRRHDDPVSAGHRRRGPQLAAAGTGGHPGYLGAL